MNVEIAQLLNVMTSKKQKLEFQKQNASTLKHYNQYRERINETNLIIEVINYKDNSRLSITEKFEQGCV